MIDKTGTVKLIDFGSVRVAGVAEMPALPNNNDSWHCTVHRARVFPG